MYRARNWLVATAAIVAVSSSASAFAQTKPNDKAPEKAKTQTVHQQTEMDTKAAKKAKERQEEMGRARASQTTVTSAEAPPPMTPPPGAEKKGIEVNWPIMIASAGLLAATYIPTAVVGLTGRDDTRTLLVPVVGPWISLGARNCNLEPCDAEALDTVLMITSGVLQGVAAAGIALSVFIPPPERGSVPGVAKATPPKVQVTPLSFGRAGAGIGAVGTF